VDATGYRRSPGLVFDRISRAVEKPLWFVEAHLV
jgi:hypothetical protein